MFVVVRYTFRLRMTDAQRRQLEIEWDRCRWVWNECVAETRRRYAAGEKAGGVCEVSRWLTGWRGEHEWLTAGSSVAQQQTTRDFNAALDKARKDRAAGLGRRGRGFPKFRKRDRALPTLEYTRRGFGISDGVLVLAGGVRVRPVWSRELPSEPSSVRIYRDPVGHWHASFVVERALEPLPESGGEIGIDWGIKAVATATEPAFDLSHSHHGDRAAGALARYQRQQARRRRRGQPSTAGYKRASQRVARLHAKVKEQRRDEARKWAITVVRSHDVIAIEDFKPRFLAANRRLARKGLDARIGAARRALEDAARKHDRTLIVVPAAYTTMDCSSCGARAKHRLPLSQRTYQCDSCGHTQDRDRNAANNVLALATVRAGLNPAGDDRVRQGVPLAA